MNHHERFTGLLGAWLGLTMACSSGDAQLGGPGSGSSGNGSTAAGSQPGGTAIAVTTASGLPAGSGLGSAVASPSNASATATAATNSAYPSGTSVSSASAKGSNTTASASTASGSASGSSGAYSACFNGGTLDRSLKSCTSNADCTYAAHKVDCCGQIEYVGVAKSSAALLASCEQSWQASLGLCLCAQGLPVTEDGKTDADGGAPSVYCNPINSGSFCTTYLP